MISKILIERLKKVLHKLVDSQQKAFISARHITDVVLIANECLDSRLKEEKYGIMCKLDIEKEYDHVNWKFFGDLTEKWGWEGNGSVG